MARSRSVAQPQSHPAETHFDAEGFHLGRIDARLRVFSKLAMAVSASIALLPVTTTIFDDVTAVAVWTIHKLRACSHFPLCNAL